MSCNGCNCRNRLSRWVVILALVALVAAHAVAAHVVAVRAGRVVSGVVTLSGRPLDENREFELVLFFVDDTCVYTTNSPPFSYDLDTRQLTDGRHTLRVEAYRGTVRIARSDTHAVIVSNTDADVRGDTTIEIAFSTAPRTRDEFKAQAALAARPARSPAAVAKRASSSGLSVARANSVKASAKRQPPVARAAAPEIIVDTKPVTRGAVRVFLDGEDLKLAELSAQPERELLYLPARATFERLGARGVWTPDTQTFFSRVGEKKVWLTVGERAVRINRIPRELEAPIRMDNQQRLQIPVGVCRQAFDLRVVWVRDAGRVELFTEKEDRPAPVGSPISRLLDFLRALA